MGLASRFRLKILVLSPAPSGDLPTPSSDPSPLLCSESLATVAVATLVLSVTHVQVRVVLTVGNDSKN